MAEESSEHWLCGHRNCVEEEAQALVAIYKRFWALHSHSETTSPSEHVSVLHITNSLNYFKKFYSSCENQFLMNGFRSKWSYFIYRNGTYRKYDTLSVV
jgi:hypothetical protein